MLAATLSGTAFGEVIIRSGDSIAFVGDSNTASGWSLPSGYVRFVMQALEQAGLKVTPIPAGVGGDTSERMRIRIDAVLSRKPTWLTLSTGFNDVSPVCAWQVRFDDFRKNVITMLDKAHAAGVKVILLTPTLFNDVRLENDTNRKAAPYVEFLRQTARERNLPIADLNAFHRAEMARLSAQPTGPVRSMTYDGIHMNPRGNMMMATGVLNTLGFTGEQIAKAREQWLEAPYRRAVGGLWLDMNAGQIEKAEDFAAREKVPFRPMHLSNAGGFEEPGYFRLSEKLPEDADANPALQLLWDRALISAARASQPKAPMRAIREAARVRFGKDLDALLESGISMKDLR